MPSIRCWQVDAFTNQPFRGNPAAVCWLEDPVPAAWMQSVAAEMNLSETAFVTRQGNQFGLRWFTPRMEVALCGHATLAAAHVLWGTDIHTSDEPIVFQTMSGPLACRHESGRIDMDFPATPVKLQPASPELVAALGVSPVESGKTAFDEFIVVEDPQTLRSMTPDFRSLAQVDTRGVIVTCRSDDPQFDFLSRFFAPAAGVDEDPVTGSAHCALAPYWAGVLGKEQLIGYQGSERGGVVSVHAAGDRVVLGGEAVTVWEGSWLHSP